LEEGRAGKHAVYYEHQAITYAELAKSANRLGNALLGLGVERENRVMICLPDCPQFFASYFGAMKIDAVPLPVSTMALPQDYRYYLNDSGAKALIIHQDLAPNIKGSTMSCICGISSWWVKPNQVNYTMIPCLPVLP
jgi:acyl-coenzyme A synthetase/AMP-(fatty) acid ligase